MLQNWARHIDFTCLRHLTLGGCLDMIQSGLSGETMEWIVQTQSFPNVNTLSVNLTRDDLNVEKPRYREHAISFFRAFKSLEQLSIKGPMDYQIVDSVLAHHGQTLKKLSLHPFEDTPIGVNVRDLRDLPFDFTKDSILQLRAQCPVLEELTILVKRDKSSVSEAEIYSGFGEMRDLRALSLLLECSNWRVTRDPTYAPDFDKHDQEPVETDRYPWLKKGELKEAFINCAVDEALACSIWKIISQNKTGRPLERLKLWPTGAGEYGTAARLPPTFAGNVQNLARPWLFERVPRDDTEDFTITELRQKRRLALDEQEARFMAHPQDPEFWKVFHSIWPPQNGSKDFRRDWSSFPLSEKSRVSHLYAS